MLLWIKMLLEIQVLKFWTFWLKKFIGEGWGIVVQGQCGTEIAFLTFYEQTLWIWTIIIPYEYAPVCYPLKQRLSFTCIKCCSCSISCSNMCSAKNFGQVPQTFRCVLELLSNQSFNILKVNFAIDQTAAKREPSLFENSLYASTCLCKVESCFNTLGGTKWFNEVH